MYSVCVYVCSRSYTYIFYLFIILRINLLQDFVHRSRFLNRKADCSTVLLKFWRPLLGLTCHEPMLTQPNHVIYRVAQKSKPLPNKQKIVLRPVNEIRFIRQIKVWIRHNNIIRGIIYSKRDLLSDLNNYAWPAKLAICVRYCKWCQRFLLHQLALESG